MYGLNGAVGLHASSCQRSLEICHLRAQAGAAWPKVAGQHGSAGRTPLQCWGGRSCVPLRFLRGAAGWRSALGTAPSRPVLGPVRARLCNSRPGALNFLQGACCIRYGARTVCTSIHGGSNRAGFSQLDPLGPALSPLGVVVVTATSPQ